MKRVVVKIDADIAQRARNAVMFLRSNGEPKLTMTDIVDRAVAEYVTRLGQETNGGEDFPAVGPMPRGSQLSKGV